MTDIEPDGLPEKDERPFINGDRPYTPQPERPGCISAYLIFGLILNCICVLVYMFLMSGIIKAPRLTPFILMMLIVISVLHIFFCVKLLLYKKSGFYGLVVCALIAYVMNLLAGLSPFLCTLALGGIPILYAILQVRRNGIPFWKRLK